LQHSSDVIIPPVPHDKGRGLDKSLLQHQELPTFEEFDIARHHEMKDKEPKGMPGPEDYEHIHKMIRSSCIVALVIWFCIIVLLSIILEENPFNILIGLSPVLLTIIVTHILVDKYHLESGFLMVFPFIFTGIMLMLGMAGMLPEGMEYLMLASVNIIFGVLFEASIVTHHGLIRKQLDKPEEKPKEEVKKVIVRLDDEGLRQFVSSIEDKAKAINAVIGRIYSVKHGGTEPMRKKIRIDPETYNEINELKNQPHEKRRVIAIEMLRKIKDKLDQFMKPEREVFDKHEIKSLISLQRNADGNDKIIEVLIKNDKDPVKSYYDGAVEFCDDALDDLVANELETMKRRSEERKQRKVAHAKKVIEDANKKEE
jgi:hypothetical protein